MGVRSGGGGGSGNVGERIGEEERGKRDKGRRRRKIWLRTLAKSNGSPGVATDSGAEKGPVPMAV